MKYLSVIVLAVLTGCTTMDVLQTGKQASEAGKALIAEDLMVTRDERTARREAVKDAVDKCLEDADDARTWAEAKPIYEDCLEFMDRNQHKLVIERLSKVINDAKDNEQTSGDSM